MISDKHQQNRLKIPNVFVCYISNKQIPYKDPVTEKLSINHAEYSIRDLNMLKQPAGSAKTLLEALVLAKRSKCKYMLYVEVGNIVDWADGISQHIADEIKKYNNDIQFIGHVLQHKNGSFFIHPQFCLFDVDWALAQRIQQFSSENKGKAILYTFKRSEENFHDGYTPHWVTPTGESKRFEGAGRGANILNAIATSNGKVGIWPETVRDKKKYVYPTVAQEVEKHKFLFLNQFDTTRVYVGNTERIDPDKFKNYRDYNIQKLYTPASGLNTFLLAYYCRANHTTAYDISLNALDMIQTYIDQWDGVNYKEFFFDVIAPSEIKRTFYKSTGVNLDNAQKLLESLGGEWVSWWRQNKNTFNVTSMNLMDQYTWHRFKTHQKLGNVPTLLNTSNIFHYAPTSIFFSIEERVQLIKNLRGYLHKHIVSEENLYVAGLNPLTGDPFKNGRLTDKDLKRKIKYSWR